MRRDLPGFCQHLTATYGELAAFRAGVERGYLVSHPDYIHEMLRQDVAHYHKGRYTQRLEALFGAGLLSSNGDRWRQRRQALQPAFTKSRVGIWFDILVEATDALLDRWEWAASQQQPVDMAAEMLRLVQTLMVPILFGRSLHYTVSTSIVAAIDTLTTHLLRHYLREMVLDGVLNRLPLPRVRRFHQAVHHLRDTLDHWLAMAPDGAADPDALVHWLRADPAWPDAPQRRDELVSFFIAGQETTAVALAWTFHFLAEHPAWSERLRQEAQGVFANGMPTLDSVATLTTTRQVIDESLRLMPPAYIIGRRPLADETLGPWQIPADALVFVSPYAMHRHPAYWEQPERFDPTRFAPDNTQARPRYTYFPFGGGPRVCIGQHLALLELTFIIARVMQRFTLQPQPGQFVIPTPAITLRPRYGIKVLLTRR